MYFEKAFVFTILEMEDIFKEYKSRGINYV